MNYTIERSGSLRDSIVSMVRDRKFHSERAHSFFYQRLPILYALYRGTLRMRSAPFRNNVHIPLIFTYIQADVSKKVETLFSTYPYVTFTGYGPDDAAYARKQEAVVSAQFEDSNILQKAIEVFLTADLYGTAIIQYGWDVRERDIVVSHVTDLPISGQTIREDETIKYRDFDGPNFEVIDLLDFFPQPGPKRIEDMHWVIVRRWMELEDLEDMAARGIYDTAEVRRLKSEGGSFEDSQIDYKEFRFARLLGESPSSSIQNEPLNKAVEVLEYWGRVPAEYCPDGKTTRVITIANGRFLLRNRPNPFWAGRKPFLAFSPTPDPHHFFAIGKAEVVAKLQIVANRFTNQQLDAIDKAIDPAFIYNENSGLDPARAQLWPNRWIGMNGPVDGNFAPITPDLRGIELGTAKTVEIGRWMQQSLGIIDDVSLGIKSGDDTARGVLARSEAVATRLMLEARLAEKNFIEPLADAYIALDKQYLDLPRELIILGESAQADPISGAPPVLDRNILTPADLIPSYAARARGAANRIGKGVYQQNLVLLMQAASQNPVVAGAVNWLNFFRTIFREFEIENVNELIATQEEFQRMQAMANGQMGAEVPGTPNGVVSGNPQFLGAAA